MIFFACLILLELTTLPHYIVEFISSNGRIKDFDKSCLKHIASYGSLDSLCTLYLLHHWGVTINSTALSNDCCSLLINSLELLLKRNPHFHRSHVFLFDELCDQIFLIELKGYSRPLKIKLNWREYRRKNWSSEVKEISTKAEADFRIHPKLQDFIPSTDPNLEELYKKLFV